jgi:DNA-binding NarL/FixJ family response regulator
MHGHTNIAVFTFGYTVTAPGPFVPSNVRSWRPAPVEALRPTPSPLGNLGLTERERDVAELAVSGFSYAQIARDLFVAQTTVGYHLSNIYAKCGVRSRHELTELVRSNAVLAGQR